MSNSETSSDIKVKYENSNGDNLLEDKHTSRKQYSTDTDYYFNIIANPSKTVQKTMIEESDSSELNDIINQSNTSDNSSRRSSHRSSHRSSDKSKSSEKSSSDSSRRKTSESREKYEKISINPNNLQSSQTVNKIQPPYVPPPYVPPPTTSIKPTENKELTPGEIRMKKIEILRKLSEIKSKGYNLSKEYDFNSSLDEMEYEYELLKSFADKRNGVKVFRSGLLQVVSLVEFLNDKYDPFDFHLSGWGDHMQLETENWEDVLEEIYEKYKGTGKKMAPEIRLLLLIIASASAFHFTKSQSANLPGLDSLLASNPALLSKIINPKKEEGSRFMTSQEINIEKQKAELKKNNPQMKQPPLQHQMMQSQLNQSTRQDPQPTYPISGNMSSGMPNIRAPSQVKDILNRIHNLQPTNLKQSNTETQDETSSNNDRLISESTLSEANSKKRIAARKPKKSSISIM